MAQFFKKLSNFQLKLIVFPLRGAKQLSTWTKCWETVVATQTMNQQNRHFLVKGHFTWDKLRSQWVEKSYNVSFEQDRNCELEIIYQDLSVLGTLQEYLNPSLNPINQQY